MFVHKLLKGIGAEKYLPFALARLRALEKVYGAEGYFTQRYETDGYKIAVRQLPPFQYLEITGGITGPKFEYFWSDHVDGWWLASPGLRRFEVEDRIGGIYGGGMRVTYLNIQDKEGEPPVPKEKKVKVKPLYSTVLKSDDKSWFYKEPLADTYVDLANRSKNYFTTWASWQSQHVCEYGWYWNNKPDVLVTSASATMSRSSLAGWGDYFWNDVFPSRIVLYDIYYDMAPVAYKAGGSDTSLLGILGPYLGDNCWWRHAAMRVVKSEQWGTRKFFIVGDNKGRLHVYPAKPYWHDPEVWAACKVVFGFQSAASTAIPFKTVTPAYPSWVTPAKVDEIDVLLWWNWQFNKDATKAATIALNAKERAGFFFFEGETLNQQPAFDILAVSSWRASPESTFSTAVDEYGSPQALFHPSKRGRAPRILTPGLVEIKIDIEITGEKEMDFEVSTTVLKQDYFGDSGRYYLDCGYLYKDKRITEVDSSLVEDTLVSSEIQVYNKDGNWWCKRILPAGAEDGWGDTLKLDDTLERFSIPDDPMNGDYILRTEPEEYRPGFDAIISRSVTTVFIIRRQDTNAEIKRELLTWGDNFFMQNTSYYSGKSHLLTPWVLTGFAPPYDDRLNTGMWTHNFNEQWYDAFHRNNLPFYHHRAEPSRPPSGEFDTWRGWLRSCDLRTLSYVIQRQIYSHTGHPEFPLAPVALSMLFDTTKIRTQIDMVAYGKPLKSIATDLNYEWDENNFYTHLVSFTVAPLRAEGFPEPPIADRVPMPKVATDIWGSCSINWIQPHAYGEIMSHPRGHFSYCAITGLNGNDIDILSYQQKQKKKPNDTEEKFVEIRSTHRELFNRAYKQARENTFYQPVPDQLYGEQVGNYRLTGWWLPYTDDSETS